MFNQNKRFILTYYLVAPLLDDNCIRESKVPEFSQSSGSTIDAPLLLNFAAPSSHPSTSSAKSWEQKERHVSGFTSDGDHRCCTPELDSLQPSFQELPRDFEVKGLVVDAKANERTNTVNGRVTSIAAWKRSGSPNFFLEQFDDRIAKLEEVKSKWNEPCRGFPVSVSCDVIDPNFVVQKMRAAVTSQSTDNAHRNFSTRANNQSTIFNYQFLDSNNSNSQQNRQLLERHWLQRRQSVVSIENASCIDHVHKPIFDERCVKSPLRTSLHSFAYSRGNEIQQENSAYFHNNFTPPRKEERFNQIDNQMLNQGNLNSRLVNQYSESGAIDCDSEFEPIQTARQNSSSGRSFSENLMLPSNQHNQDVSTHSVRGLQRTFSVASNAVSSPKIPVDLPYTALDATLPAHEKKINSPQEDFLFRQPKIPNPASYSRRKSLEGMFLFIYFFNLQ